MTIVAIIFLVPTIVFLTLVAFAEEGEDGW
jgi:hypothetical protein